MPNPRDIQSLIWGAKGPNYQAPFDEVLAALAHSIAEYYRARMWDPYTAIKHRWYFAHQEGLQGWSKLEAGQWVPFQPHYTPRRNTGQLVGLLIIDGEHGWVRAGRPAYNAASRPRS